jgi:hypothetical protein
VRPERASLASQQTALLALITGRDLGAITPDAASLIAGDARASAEERLHVYAHMYQARIAEALESQFPRFARLLGADEFGELTAAYIADEPSRQPSLRYVGERLPAWLAARRGDTPAMAGLAALEWARADVFDLVDEPPMTLESVREWPPDRFGELPLRLMTAHRLVTVPGGTARLWDSLGMDVDGGAPDREGPAQGENETLIVWRDGTVVYHRTVDAGERAALALASQGTHFGVICESLLTTHGDEGAVAHAYTWISTWLADGLVRAARPA